MQCFALQQNIEECNLNWFLIFFTLQFDCFANSWQQQYFLLPFEFG
jgi:hypothetical protein